MLKYIIKRILLIIPVVIGITLFVYLLLDLAPGDPVTMMLGTDASPEQIAQLRQELGLDQNVLVRYFHYMVSAVQGDFGVSWTNSQPVINEFLERFPNTLALAFSALAITIVFGLSFGTIAAVWQNKPIDGATLIAALLFASMPTFWFGLMLQLLFALKLGWFPAMGVGTIGHMVLPAVSLSLGTIANQIRMTRSSVLDVIDMNYVRTARAKGAGEFHVVFRHVIRNALMPVVTNWGLTFATAFGGTIISETVFSIPGISSFLINAVKVRDVPVVMGTVIIVAVIVAVINLFIDLVYAVIDPRVKLGYIS
ncbi:ABC transporter permease [Clostridium sp. Marseille-P3244]|uniref:ABC transporter permease n=1 Tax=Clostridium sp. Marseille-P3244 TaxID=1871020 RepID=UPI000930E92F|nr:ABC transporter permease [Clostridium sp. Marseille-P3244]